MNKMTFELKGKQLNGEQLEKSITKSFEGKELEALKDSFEQEALALCKEHGVHGIFFATRLFEENGNHLEADESHIFIDKEYESVTSFETNLDEEYYDKAVALIEALGLGVSELENIEVSAWNVNMLIINGKDYLVVNAEERENAVTDEIRESLWAFNPSFLAEETDSDLLPVYESFVKSDLCESANEAILCLVEKFNGLESFVESAVSADGYGHFLSRYDGSELEQGEYFIYRS